MWNCRVSYCYVVVVVYNKNSLIHGCYVAVAPQVSLKMRQPTPNTGKNWIVGITGGIASGKSTAAKILDAHGVVIIDADDVSRIITAVNTPVWKKIIAYFGAVAQHPDGSLNRAYLRKCAAINPAALKMLAHIQHAAVRAYIQQEIVKPCQLYIAVVAPLLFEAGLHQLCDRTLVIDTQIAIQRQRAIARDNERSFVETVIQAQLPRQQRIQRADDVIVNTKSMQQFTAQMENLHTVYLRKL